MMDRNEVKQQKGFLANVTEFVLLLVLVFLIRTFGFGLYQVPTGSMETTMLVGERFFADKFSYVVRNPERGEIIAFNEPTYRYSANQLVKLWEHYVWGPANWTKRVIGMPGDTVKGVIEDGKPVIYLNGRKLNEPYLNKYPLIHVRNRSWCSFDSSRPLDMQPFYNITDPVKTLDGDYELLYPGTPLRTSFDCPAILKQGKRVWNGSDEFTVELGADEYWVMGDNRLGSQDSRCFGPIKRATIHARIVFRIWSIDSTASWWIVDLIKHPVSFWQRIRWDRFFQRVK